MDLLKGNAKMQILPKSYYSIIAGIIDQLSLRLITQLDNSLQIY